MVLQVSSQEDVWIFGYGSLMWKPGFAYEEVSLAHLDGYHRDLCILSYVFRGTPDVPGLVMGLCHSGACTGRAFRVKAKLVPETISYLDEREMINNVYEPSWVEITLEGGRKTRAYTFIAKQDHSQYVAHFDLDEKVRHVLQGVGKGGSALEYLENTIDHLRDLGIQDSALDEIWAALRKQMGKKV